MERWWYKIKPILRKILPFDASEDKVITYSYTGNQQFSVKITIALASNNQVVYENKIDTFRLETIIPRNTLTNGNSYTASVIVYDKSNIPSDASDKLSFITLTNPTFGLLNIVNNQIITSSSYIVSVNYSQAENELLNEFKIDLYDFGHNLIDSSEILYPINGLDYRLKSLLDNRGYYIKLTGNTVNGMQLSAPEIFFSVEYIQPSMYAKVILENIESQASIKIQSNLILIDGNANHDPVEYIDGEKVDLVGDDIFTKISETGISLNAHAYSTKFSSNGKYLVIGSEEIPGIKIYKYFEGTFTKILNLDTSQITSPHWINFSSDDVYLAIAHSRSPYIAIYKRSGDTFTKLPDPDVLPTDISIGISFSPYGNYLAVSYQASPYIMIYKRSGDTFTKLPDPGVLPNGISRSISFSQDGLYLASGSAGSPYITIYKRSGDTFTKLPDPDVLPAGVVLGISFSKDDIYLAVSHNHQPNVTIYKRDGDTFTKLPDPDVLPTGTGYGTSFSNNDVYLAISHTTSPFITIYRRIGDNFKKIDNPFFLPTGQSECISFSPSDNYLAIAHRNSPFFTMYNISQEEKSVTFDTGFTINDNFICVLNCQNISTNKDFFIISDKDGYTRLSLQKNYGYFYNDDNLKEYFTLTVSSWFLSYRIVSRLFEKINPEDELSIIIKRIGNHYSINVEKRV